jgi:hypothetical protein
MTTARDPAISRLIANVISGLLPQEILETIQLTTVMGIHSCNLAIPILLEEIEKSGV